MQTNKYFIFILEEAMKVYELLEKFNRYEIHNLTAPSEKEVEKVDNAENLAAIIRKNCSMMLEAYQESGTVLLRGMKSRVPAAITAIRPDRKSVEMADETHERLHDAFLQAGLKATRKNAIFCTTSLRIAKAWGRNTYIIFIKDGWDGTVFKNLKRDYSFYNLQGLGWQNQDNDKKTAIKNMADEIKKFKPISFNSTSMLVDVLEDRYEDILMTGDSYIGLRLGNRNGLKTEDVLAKDVLELLNITPINL
jgi:predicted oxidoreductase (fatty acid repression mutant protein)